MFTILQHRRHTKKYNYVCEGESITYDTADTFKSLERFQCFCKKDVWEDVKCKTFKNVKK